MIRLVSYVCLFFHIYNQVGLSETYVLTIIKGRKKMNSIDVVIIVLAFSLLNGLTAIHMIGRITWKGVSRDAD